jgi:dTDP-4-dehydrorhamnose 3,5-epimerase-like enzyme
VKEIEMSLIREVKVQSLDSLDSLKGGTVQFYTPQSSHETMLVQVAPESIDRLFVHHFQTDQLFVVRGHLVMVVLQNRQYRYIPLNQNQPQVITIPPGVPHGAINLSDEPCVLVNAVLRHGPPNARDYRPLNHPLPLDLEAARMVIQAI